jgi:hypothetical protein
MTDTCMNCGLIIASSEHQIKCFEYHYCQCAKLHEENERLKKIIAKEFSENDELGCEYVYVNLLKEKLATANVALEKIAFIAKDAMKKIE